MSLLLAKLILNSRDQCEGALDIASSFDAFILYYIPIILYLKLKQTKTFISYKCFLVLSCVLVYFVRHTWHLTIVLAQLISLKVLNTFANLWHLTDEHLLLKIYFVYK